MESNLVTLSTLQSEAFGLCGEPTTGFTTTESTRMNVALNMAKNMILSQVGLPNSEITYSFLYTDNVYAYALPFGYVDKIMLRYDQSKGNYNNNTRANWQRNFEYVNPQEFYHLQDTQAYDIVYWSIDYVNGAPYLLINTRNIISSLIIDQANSASDWELLGDGSNLRVDSVVYSSGDASLAFDINSITNGYVTLQKNLVNTPYDWTVYDENGMFSFDVYMQNVTGITGISVNFGSSLSDYWTASTTVDSNGDPFTADTWNSLSFQWTNATMVGNPEVDNIQYYWITITYNNTFVAAQNWRIDNFMLYSPDAMVFTFYTDQVVGVNGSTTTLSNMFVNGNDTALFIGTDISIKDTLESWAAMIYKPTAIGEDNTWVQQMATSGLKTLQVRYPKKVINYLARVGYNTNRNHGRRSAYGR